MMMKDFIIALKLLKDLYNVIYEPHLSYRFSSFEKKFNNFLDNRSYDDNSYFIQEKGIMGDAKLLYVISKEMFPYFYEDLLASDFYKEGVVSLDYDSIQRRASFC